MNLQTKLQPQIEAIETAGQALGFVANCDIEVANFCALLARSVGGDWLELGTGTGLSTLFLAEVLTDGRLDTVDNAASVSKAAQGVIGTNKNINFIVEDGGAFLKKCKSEAYRFIFSDAWPGKFSHLNHALNALEVGGLYVIDDLLPQHNWPPNHQPRVDALLALFDAVDNFAINYLDWASGVAIVTKLGVGGIDEAWVNRDAYTFLFSEAIPDFGDSVWREGKT